MPSIRTKQDRYNRPMNLQPNRWMHPWYLRRRRHDKNLAKLHYKALRLRGILWLNRQFALAHCIWLASKDDLRGVKFYGTLQEHRENRQRIKANKAKESNKSKESA